MRIGNSLRRYANSRSLASFYDCEGRIESGCRRPVRLSLQPSTPRREKASTFSLERLRIALVGGYLTTSVSTVCQEQWASKRFDT